VILAWLGGQIGPFLGICPDWSIQSFLSWIFYPLVWLMGVPGKDVPAVANLLGLRLVATEVPAYFMLSGLIESGSIEPRSAVIAAYALCGFAHIPSLAIFVGGATALAPNRKSDIARVAWIALFIATLTCLLTGAIAGLFYTGNSVLWE
jgi:CNT family concentrative nucleoside transporter